MVVTGGNGRRLEYCSGAWDRKAGSSYGEVSEWHAEMLGVTFLGKMGPLRVFEQRRLILAELETLNLVAEAVRPNGLEKF